MKLDSFIRMLMPREESFRNFLAADTRCLKRAAVAFEDVARSTSLEERRVKAVEMKSIEHEGDSITKQIFTALNSTFITPFDREDLRQIASDLDDILDYIEGCAHSFVILELSESPEGLRQFASILRQMTEEIDVVTGLIWDLSNEPKIQASIVRISELENQADALYSTVIADLFKSDKRTVDILKWKEIYETLESACDACKDYTHVLGNIVVKNA